MRKAKINHLSKIDKTKFPEGFATRILCNDPYIVKIRRFLNTEECETMIEMAHGKFKRSTIVYDDELIESSTRTSSTAFVTDNGHFEKYSEPVERILEKVMYLTGCKRRQIEGLMVVKYSPGQEYQQHHDFFKPEHTDMMGGNFMQRILTFFCYLTSLDSEDGGETEFPLLDLKIKPSKGTAVFWWNQKPDGTLIEETLHRGNPVLGDKTKYGLNIWIRENDFYSSE